MPSLVIATPGRTSRCTLSYAFIFDSEVLNHGWDVKSIVQFS